MPGAFGLLAGLSWRPRPPQPVASRCRWRGQRLGEGEVPRGSRMRWQLGPKSSEEDRGRR